MKQNERVDKTTSGQQDRQDGFTTAPVMPGSEGQITPEFIRLPKPGQHCPYTGLTRSYLNLLVLPCPANHFRPPVKAVSLRRRGCKHGVKLISYDSLLHYLNHFSSTGPVEPQQPEPTQKGGDE